MLEGGVRVRPLMLVDMDKFLENKGLCVCPGQCSRKDLVLAQGAKKFGDQVLVFISHSGYLNNV